jgi:3-methyl-2-oxobutanoate hydroxymethyltransferase
VKRTSTKTIRQSKGVRQIACLTAYDSVTARIAERGGADLLLVGDSVGNTLLGFANSVAVTLEMIEHHTAAVARVREHALLVADIPFAVAHYSFDRLLDACARLMRVGADAVKIEGGADLAPVIARLVAAGVPVCGHIGLQPQQVLQLGGYKKFGANTATTDDAAATDAATAARIRENATVLADAAALEAAGCFALVGEMLAAALAAQVRDATAIPLIGIGSGPDCDGQVLVIHDLLGLTENPPPFVKPRAQLAQLAVAAVADWAAELRGETKPAYV